MCGSELSLQSGTDTGEADESKAEWPLGIEASLTHVLAHYSFDSSSIKSDSSAATSSDDSEKTDIQICHGKKVTAVKQII